VQDSYSNNQKSNQDFYIKIPHKIIQFHLQGFITTPAFFIYCEIAKHSQNFWLSRQKLLHVFGVNKNNIKQKIDELLSINAIDVKKSHNGRRGIFCKINDPRFLRGRNSEGAEIPTRMDSEIPTRMDSEIPTRMDTNKTNNKNNNNPPLNPPHTVGWTSKKYFDLKSKNGRFNKYLEAWSEIAADDLDLIYLIETAAKRYQNETGAQFPIRITKPAVLDKFTAQVREKWKDFILRYPNPYRDSSN